jgi:hypothetical protein
MRRATKSLRLTAVDGKLDAESVGIVAGAIAWALSHDFPADTREIVESWDRISDTVVTLALPMLEKSGRGNPKRRVA